MIPMYMLSNDHHENYNLKSNKQKTKTQQNHTRHRKGTVSWMTLQPSGKLSHVDESKTAFGPPWNFLDMPLLKYGRKIYLRRRKANL